MHTALAKSPEHTQPPASHNPRSNKMTRISPRGDLPLQAHRWPSVDLVGMTKRVPPHPCPAPRCGERRHLETATTPPKGAGSSSASIWTSQSQLRPTVSAPRG